MKTNKRAQRRRFNVTHNIFGKLSLASQLIEAQAGGGLQLGSESCAAAAAACSVQRDEWKQFSLGAKATSASLKRLRRRPSEPLEGKRAAVS